MHCPGCGFKNPPAMRFCGQCGEALPRACAACGFANPQGFGFCGQCGARLEQAQAPSAPSAPSAADEIERRQVTVLFADLTGYTELTRRLGAERTHKLVRGFFDQVDQLVSSHGGVVERHVGDSVMAVFGLPVAHGNDPERAVRAALAIHAAMPALSAAQGAELQVHAGVAAGPIVVERLGEGSDAAYTTVGDAVNLAARLVALARPGETVISESVHRALADLVQAEPLGEVSVKGVEQPVAVWRAHALGAERAARRAFVGRRAEVSQFEAACRAGLDANRGQVLYLRGEAGIGKTRLVEEFGDIAGAHGFTAHTGLVLDFGIERGEDAIARILRSLLRQAIGGEDSDPPALVAGAVQSGAIDAAQEVFLHDLLGLALPPSLRGLYDAMSSETRRQGRQDCVAAIARHAAGQRPILIAVEDLQWADDQILGHVAQLAQITRASPVLLVLTARPEGDPLDHAWRAAAGRVPLTTIDLGPLAPDEAMALARQFESDALDIAQRCVTRAEGNPLFLVQLLRSASAGADAQEAVPGSIQSVMLSLVDRLQAPDRRSIQAASVLGQRFADSALRAIVGDGAAGFEGLIEHHLLRRVGEDYLFQHALIQESVYESLLSEQRKLFHGRAAAWFADRDSMLHARHLDRAEDPGAAQAYLAAAAAERQRFHYEAALTSVERALAKAETDAMRFEVRILQGATQNDLGRTLESIESFRAAADLADDGPARLRAWLGLVWGLRVADRYDEAIALLERAELIARQHGLDLELAWIHYQRGNIFFPLGKIERCQAEHEIALDHARRAGSREAEALAWSGLGDASYARGLMRTANNAFSRCVEIAHTEGLGRIEVVNRGVRAITSLMLGDVAGSKEDSTRASDMARLVGDLRGEMIAGHVRFQLAFQAGDLGSLAAMGHREIEIAQTLRAPRFEAEGLILLSLAIPARQEQLLREALAICRATGMAFVGPIALAMLSMVTDDDQERKRALAEGESVLEQGCPWHSMAGFIGAAMEGALWRGEWDEAERLAGRLEASTRIEPLPPIDFLVGRARALAAHGRGRRDPALAQELAALERRAEELKIAIALPTIRAALADVGR